MRNNLGQTEEEFLKTYNPDHFERPSLTVDDLFLTINEIPSSDVRKLSEKTIQVLLLKRTQHPHINAWALPGVFANLNETLEESSIRALEEKTEFRDVYLEQLFTFGDLNRDKRTRVISVAYMGLVAKNTVTIKKTKDQEETNWFTLKLIEKENRIEMILSNDNGVNLTAELQIQNDQIKVIKSNNIAFDHAKIIYYGILRLRNKIEYTDVAFSLVPEKFTYIELQQVYELILNKTFTKANFQRKVKSRVEATEEYRTGGFRPARLFKYKPEE